MARIKKEQIKLFRNILQLVSQMNLLGKHFLFNFQWNDFLEKKTRTCQAKIKCIGIHYLAHLIESETLAAT